MQQDDKPLVSIIVPAYNAENYVEHMVHDIRSQEYARLECIIVDDGSSDNTVQVITRLIKDDLRFVLKRHKKNRGLSAARNTGYGVATGKYVIFLDVDDEFRPQLTQDALCRAEETDADIVIFNFDEYRSEKKIRFKNRIDTVKNPSKRIFTIDDFVAYSDEPRFGIFLEMVWNKFYKKSFLDQHDIRFNEKLLRAEDTAFTIRTYLLAEKISYLPQSLLTYVTEIKTSNQGTISKHPTAFLAMFDDLREFLYQQNIYSKYMHDLRDLAVAYIIGNLMNGSVDTQRNIIIEGKKFSKSFGIKPNTVKGISAVKRQMLTAFIDSDFDAYIDAQKAFFISERDDLLSRIPPLEDRIQLELAELSIYRDNPSIHTAYTQLMKAVRRKLGSKFS